VEYFEKIGFNTISDRQVKDKDILGLPDTMETTNTLLNFHGIPG
jgi:hypothetical protein